MSFTLMERDRFNCIDEYVQAHMQEMLRTVEESRVIIRKNYGLGCRFPLVMCEVELDNYIGNLRTKEVICQL